ncbi:MAG TPA: hypothetical protein VE868_13235, partial [Balneolaceae bacterium]|nr:hypothetical protein [Balneolaceae bacterium]
MHPNGKHVHASLHLLGYIDFMCGICPGDLLMASNFFSIQPYIGTGTNAIDFDECVQALFAVRYPEGRSVPPGNLEVPTVDCPQVRTIK